MRNLSLFSTSPPLVAPQRRLRPGRWLLLALALLPTLAAHAQVPTVTLTPGANTISNPGTYVVNVPANTASLQVQGWGSGGRGGLASGLRGGTAGGGGGGGAYATTTLANPAGQSYLLTVGGNGTASTLTNTSGTVVLLRAVAGQPGEDNTGIPSNGGAGGQASASFPVGSSVSGSAGGSTTNTIGGAGGTAGGPGGGVGGASPPFGNNGLSGTAPGGGGSGSSNGGQMGGAGGAGRAVLTVTLAAPNQAPVIANQSRSVAENSAIATAVGAAVTASDPDAGQTLTYAITAGNAAGKFFISNAGQITVAGALDFETTNSYALTVRVTDNGSPALSSSATVTVSVSDVNEAPTALALSNTTLAENNAPNAVVGTLSTTDPDAGNTFTYALESEVASFSLSGNTLRLTPSADFEVRSTYPVSIRTTDQGGRSFVQNFFIGIENVNEAPTALALSSTRVDENVAPNTLVGTFSVTDPDDVSSPVRSTPTPRVARPVGGPQYIYTLVSGDGSTDNAAFAIPDETDELRLVASPDFETKPSYAIRVRVTEFDGVFFEQAFTIAVNDVVEGPTLTSLSPDSGPVGSPVTLTGNDFSPFDRVFFGTAPATIMRNLGTELEVIVPAGVGPGPVAVTLTNPNGTSNALTFTVTAPANAAPSNIFLSNAAVAENAPNAVVGLLTTDDGDVADTHTYALVSGFGDVGNGAFTLVGNQLRVGATALDFEAQSNYTVRIRTTDSGAGNLSFTKFFTITVTDVAEDLVVSTRRGVPAGLYNNITVTGTGEASLTGNVVVNGAFVVQSGGSLETNSTSMTGPGSFTLADGAALVISTRDGISALPAATGAVRLTGGRSFSTGARYIYLQDVTQQTGTGLPATVRSLEMLNDGSTLTLTQPVAITEVLRLNAGTLVTAGNALTLLSGASGTALLVNENSGTVSGDVTVQRYIDPSLNAGLGYRHLTAPVLTTLADLTGPGVQTEIREAATYNSSATPGTTTPFPTLFFYNQSRLSTATNNYAAFDKGFEVPTSLDRTMESTRGFVVQARGGALIDFVGPANQTDLEGRTLTRELTGPNAADAGWHLLGNPYPSPLDLGTIKPGQRNNVDAAFYTFESTSQYGGGYRSFINGFGDPLVGTAQGFFVRVSAGQGIGNLDLTNANRVTDYTQQAPVRRGAADTRPQLQLTLAGQGLTDALTVYAQAGATTGFDGEFDAAKLWNSHGLSVATLAASGEALAIDGRPAFPLAQPVPLSVRAPRAGTYTLTAATLANLPAGTDVVLVDLSTGTRTPLQAGTRYTLTLPAGTSAGRLQLEVAGRPLNTASQLAQQLSLYPNPTEGLVQLVRPAAWGRVQVQVLNAVGQLVQTAPLAAAEQQLDVRSLPAGVYTLRLTTQQGQTLTKRLVRQ